MTAGGALRPPPPVFAAAVLAVAYAAVFVVVAGILLLQLVTGTGGIGHESLGAAGDRGVVTVVILLAGAAALLVSGSVRLVRRGLRALLVAPLTVFLLIGGIGEVSDLAGDAGTASNLIGAGILVLAAAPLVLVAQPSAHRWVRERR